MTPASDMNATALGSGHATALIPSCSVCREYADLDSLVIRAGRFVHPQCEAESDSSDEVDRTPPERGARTDGRADVAADAADGSRCGARTRAGGGHPCRLYAGHGTAARGVRGARCKFHCGSTPSGLIHAEYRAAEHALRLLGQPIATDPLEGLQRAVDSAAGLHAGLQQLVREAAASDDSRALVSRLQLYADAIDRLARTAKAAVEAKLTERQTALTNAQGALLVKFVLAALAAAAIPRDLHSPFRKALAAEMDRHIEGETQ